MKHKCEIFEHQYYQNSTRHRFKKRKLWPAGRGVPSRRPKAVGSRHYTSLPQGLLLGAEEARVLLDLAILSARSQPRLGWAKRLTPQLLPRGIPAFSGSPALPVIWGGNFHPLEKTSLAFQHVSRCSLFFFVFFLCVRVFWKAPQVFGSQLSSRSTYWCLAPCRGSSPRSMTTTIN